MKFELQYNDPKSNARAGLITTDHGLIETPIFMPVGTQGTVKGVHIPELRDDIKAQIILGNTYHLYLRPGIHILEKVGGLHKFNGWERPILTDSGGFQVFSLSDNRKLHEEGAEFRSHIDGSKHLFTPEKVMDIERTIGADIIMAFDECCPGDADYDYAKQSLGLTQRWLDRCFKRFNETDPKYGYSQCLFPIVQGCVFNILEAIERGVDMFDCIMPTRNGRNGQLFTRFGTINMRNKKWEDDFSPIDPDGHSYVDTLYSKAYLHHLIKVNELLGLQIASIHNLAFYLWLVKEARAHIIAGDYTTWKAGMVRQLANRL